MTDEGVEELQERFRKVEIAFEGEVKKEWPKSWWKVRQAEGRMEFVHSQFSEANWEEEKQVFGPGAQVTVGKMSLREIYLAIARSSEGPKEG